MLHHSLPYPFQIGFLTEPESRLGLRSPQWSSCCCHSHFWPDRYVCGHIQLFYKGVGDSISGIHACTVLLPTEASPQSCSNFYTFWGNWWYRIAITTTSEAKTGGSEIQGQHGLQSNFNASLEQLNEINFQNKKIKKRRYMTGDIVHW